MEKSYTHAPQRVRQRKNKTVWPAHPISGVEGDATATSQGAGEPELVKKANENIDNGRTKGEVRSDGQKPLSDRQNKSIIQVEAISRMIVLQETV